MNERKGWPSSRVRAFWRRRPIISLLLLAALSGGLSGALVAYALDHSEYALMVAQLSDYQASVLSRVYADDGRTVIGEFYLERRLPLSYFEIPPHVRHAFIAIEDARFYEHTGIDPIRILGAFIANLRAGETVQGGSTITQQLAKMLFLNPERTYSRKLKEALLALLIERYYTKEQIIELYCNQIYLGGNAYGVEAAAQYYFGKSARELTLEEAALLAALPKAPQLYSPVTRPQAALARRNLVLEKMAEEGYISREVARAAMARPIRLAEGNRFSNARSPYAYFVEEVRRYLEEKYGTRRTHAGGLQVYTTLDARAQRAAVRAVRNGLHAYDRRHGWRGPTENVLDQGKDLTTYRHPDWEGGFEIGEYYPGLVLSVAAGEAVVRVGPYTARVTQRDAPWGRPLSQLVRPGDLTIVQVQSLDEQTKTMRVTLLQMPEVQGALVALEIPSGEIKAMVGGYDFTRMRFNHATQGLRQTGSAFKPFIYAAAVEAGLTPDDRVLDAPLQIGEWAPSNYDHTFKGSITIAQAVAESRNVPAVRILQRIGIARAVRMVERLGLPNPMAPFLPSALGATEEPLLAMTAAYAIFANQGRRVVPHMIRRVVDRDGRELERWEAPPPEQVLDPYVASTMVRLLQGVVNGGTAARIRAYAEFQEWPIAGKTGTVNDFTDAWFIGFTPTVCTGVWIGFSDRKRSLGPKETGSVAALPIWIDFMREYLKDKTPTAFELIMEMPEWIRAAREQTEREVREALGIRELPAVAPSPLPSLIAEPTGPPDRQGEPTLKEKIPDLILKPLQEPVEPPPEDPKKRRPGRFGELRP
ncbi:MAG: PBP1A family penicillin-binding protein [Blastocatellia bacterium]|nr:PBP1A family penicillin-binding protein [Blastocatellia bacterium]MCS7156279.1 PBP1A family penicillin-binding protein [Blastocatellia bacterium]MDW8169083.1 PBP1A family penicillin-binding protein [Acidobacteriota bacterium]MDW8255788.1 PBP1A family penicillin-binding protein [Acidobacteriota bacterium]